MTLLSGGFPLFCLTEEPSTLVANCELISYALAGTGIFSAFHLYANNTSDANQASGDFSLWTQAVPDGPITASANLYAAGLASCIDVSMTLYAANSGQSAAMNMWASGQGWNSGASPLTASVPLYLARNDVQSMPLYCCVGEPAQSGINLYAMGNYQETATVDLVVPEVLGLGSGQLGLYAGGR